MKKLIFSFLLLAAFPSFISACGGEHAEEISAGGGIIGLGFTGGVISTLFVVAIVLSIMVLTKSNGANERRRKRNGN